MKKQAKIGLQQLDELFKLLNDLSIEINENENFTINVNPKIDENGLFLIEIEQN